MSVEEFKKILKDNREVLVWVHPATCLSCWEQIGDVYKEFKLAGAEMIVPIDNPSAFMYYINAECVDAHAFTTTEKLREFIIQMRSKN